MVEIVQALWPVFALIMLGYLARRADFPGTAFWPLLERLIYFVLFPVLLVDRLAQADMRGVQLEWVLLAVLLLVASGQCALLPRPPRAASYPGLNLPPCIRVGCALTPIWAWRPRPHCWEIRRWPMPR